MSLSRRRFVQGAAGLFIPVAPALIFPRDATAQVGQIPAWPPTKFVSAGSSPIAFVDGVETASSNGSSVTSATINSTGANLLIVAVADFGNAAQGTVSDSKSNTWNNLTTYVDGSNLSRVRISWSSPSSVGSGHTVSYTGTQPSIGFAAFSNANASPFGAEVGTSGASTSGAGGSITPGANNGLIISAVSSLSTAPTVDSSFNVVGTSIGVGGNNFSLGMAYFIQTIAAAVNPTWTLSNGNPWAATNASFKN